MFAYLLLRDNKQSGPHSLEELKSFGVRTSDLLWIEGKSTSWCFPDEVEELQPLVQASPVNSRHAPSGRFNTEHEEEAYGKFRFEDRDVEGPILPSEKKSRPSTEKDPEDRQISKRSVEMRKNILNKWEPENFSPVQNFEIKKQEPHPFYSSATNIIKVIIADDHRLFREGVKTALAQKKEIKIIGEAENGMQLLNQLKHNRPDVILLDIQMPVMDGISALTSIRKMFADMKVIILSMHEGHSMVSTLMEAGANGYLTKTADPETIYQAIKTCYEKGYYFSDLTNVSMLEGLRSKKRIPEKISTTGFDGGDLMLKLAAAQKKSGRYSSQKTQNQMLVAACSILLIGAGVIGGITMIMGRSTKQVLSVSTKKAPNIQATSSLRPAITQQLLPTDSSKKQTDDSLQKKIDEEIISEEKNNILPEIKKDLLEKHATKKLRDSSKTSTAVLIQKSDSSVYTQSSPSPKQALPIALDLKTIARNNIHNFVTASANDYHVGGFGGLSEIEITVNNRSNYAMDEVYVEVQYILSNSKLYKTETLNFQNIQPGSSKILKAPKSPRGEKIEYKITSIKSKDLEL